MPQLVRKAPQCATGCFCCLPRAHSCCGCGCGCCLQLHSHTTLVSGRHTAAAAMTSWQRCAQSCCQNALRSIRHTSKMRRMHFMHTAYGIHNGSSTAYSAPHASHCSRLTFTSLPSQMDQSVMQHLASTQWRSPCMSPHTLSSAHHQLEQQPVTATQLWLKHTTHPSCLAPGLSCCACMQHQPVQ